MERQDIIKKRIIQTRMVLNILSVIIMYTILFLTGTSVIIRTVFLTLLCAVLIFNDIRTIRKNAYENNKISREIPGIFVYPLVALIIMKFTLLPPPSVTGTHPFQYGFSKSYTERWIPSSKPLLPEKLPENISEYSYLFSPFYLAADSSLRVDFKTDNNGIEQMEKYAEEHAAAVLDLEMYINNTENSQRKNPQVQEFKKSYFKRDENGSLRNDFSPETGRAGEQDCSDGKMFIISSNGRSHTACITINHRTSTVSFTY